jgi:heat shock protein HslJ
MHKRVPHKRHWFALPAIAVLVLAGCAAGGSDEVSPSPHPGLLVGTWMIDAEFDSPEQPFLTFAPDNSWVASDGCNRVRGTWELDASGDLTTTAGPHTLMACDGAQLPTAIELATGVETDGDDVLILVSSEGSTETRLVRTTDRTVGLHGLPIGYWVEDRTPTAPFLNFSADGSYSGEDGCNVIFGSWEAADDVVTFSDSGSTLRFCEDVDDWLSNAATGTIRSGVMTVQDAGGAVLGQLEAM